jgi:hypothetical protein
MNESFSTKKLLVLRKLTRAVADLLRGQLRDYLSAFVPVLRPRNVLGEYADGGKEMLRGADVAFKELLALYEAVAPLKPFNLVREVKTPLEVESFALEMTVVDYVHTARTDKDTKTVTVTAPLKWVLSYAGFTPRRLKDLQASRDNDRAIQQFVLHTLMMHLVMTKHTGVTKVLEALRFPVSTGRLPGFGELPITFVTSPVATVRPPDDVIIESTEISGMDAFEEVVDLAEIGKIRDPYKDRLLEVIKSHGDDLLPEIESGVIVPPAPAT